MKKFSFKKGMGIMMCALATCAFTACGEVDDDTQEIAEKFNLKGLKAIAQGDGTIIIEGTIETNKKIKTFELENDETGEVYDLLENSQSEKERREEEGKVWTATLRSKPVPVAVYTLKAETRMMTKKTAPIGEEYSFEVGTGDNEVIGSYISLVNRTSYTMQSLLSEDGKSATDACYEVEIILNSDAQTIKSADEARNSIINTNCAQAHIYDNCVITSTKCIATYNVSKSDDLTAIISGVVITSGNLLTIDVSEECFTR